MLHDHGVQSKLNLSVVQLINVRRHVVHVKYYRLTGTTIVVVLSEVKPQAVMNKTGRRGCRALPVEFPKPCHAAAGMPLGFPPEPENFTQVLIRA